MPLFAVVSVADAEAARASVAATEQPFDVLLAEVRPRDPYWAALLAAHLCSVVDLPGIHGQWWHVAGDDGLRPRACADGTARIVHLSFVEFLEGCTPSRGLSAAAHDVAGAGITVGGLLPVTCLEVSSEGGPEGAVLRHHFWSGVDVSCSIALRRGSFGCGRVPCSNITNPSHVWYEGSQPGKEALKDRSAARVALAAMLGPLVTFQVGSTAHRVVSLRPGCCTDAGAMPGGNSGVQPAALGERQIRRAPTCTDGRFQRAGRGHEGHRAGGGRLPGDAHLPPEAPEHLAARRATGDSLA